MLRKSITKNDITIIKGIKSSSNSWVSLGWITELSRPGFSIKT